MKSCISICLLAYMLIGFFIFNHLVKYDKDLFNQFYNSLNNYQIKKYKEIQYERKKIFIRFFIIGFIISLCLTIYLYNYKFLITKNNNLGCFFITCWLFIIYMGYILTPKSKYILNYLTNQNQITNWLNIYKKFRNSGHIGILIGLLLFYISLHFKPIKIKI